MALTGHAISGFTAADATLYLVKTREKLRIGVAEHDIAVFPYSLKFTVAAK